MTINNANPNTDSGDYKCIASNSVGKASHGARVMVEVEKVKFTKKLRESISIEETQLLILECETSHVVSTKWFHNDKELSGMDHRMVVQEGKTHKLVIKNTALRDSGKYKCVVKDQKTQTKVEVLERKPEFIRKIEDFETKEGEMAILEVEISSETADVQWFKDCEEIKPIDKKIEFKKEGPSRKLIIRDASVHDEGEYTCVLFDQECSADIIIVESPPEIITKLEDQTIAKGEKAIFEVELTKGDALVKWFKNSEELQFSEHVQLSIDGKRQKLKIYKSVLEDAGEYSCTVGEQTSSAILTVEEPIVDFELRLPDVTIVTKDSNAIFTVQLSQPNIDVVWYRNGKPIKPNGKYTIKSEDVTKTLNIHKTQDEDADEYTCVALNAKTSSKLKVEGYFKKMFFLNQKYQIIFFFFVEIKMPPSILLEDNDKIYKIRKNDDVSFNIKFNGTPKPDIEWATNKTIIKKSPRTIPKVEDQSACLTIKKVKEDDAGEYTIKLRNICGEAEASLKLIIMGNYN